MNCSKCQCELTEENKLPKRRVCKQCLRKQRSELDLLNRTERTRQKREARKRDRKRIFAYLSLSECIDCGEKDPVVLEFDHQYGKVDTISNMIKRSMSWTKIFAEIQKCEVRCANCHRRKTAKDFGWYSSILEEQ